MATRPINLYEANSAHGGFDYLATVVVDLPEGESMNPNVILRWNERLFVYVTPDRYEDRGVIDVANTKAVTLHQRVKKD